MTDAPDSSPADDCVVVGDGGLQVERTELSWQRTSCALVVVALVGIRCSAMVNQWLLVVVTGLGALCAAGFVVQCGRVRASTHRDRGVTAGGRVHVARSGAGRMVVLTALVSAMGVAALIVSLLLAPVQ